MQRSKKYQLWEGDSLPEKAVPKNRRSTKNVELSLKYLLKHLDELIHQSDNVIINISINYKWLLNTGDRVCLICVRVSGTSAFFVREMLVKHIERVGRFATLLCCSLQQFWLVRTAWRILLSIFLTGQSAERAHGIKTLHWRDIAAIHPYRRLIQWHSRSYCNTTIDCEPLPQQREQMTTRYVAQIEIRILQFPKSLFYSCGKKVWRTNNRKSQ